MALVGLALMAGPARAQTHKDTRRGFQFKPPRGYTAVALSPSEHVAVAKYQSDQKVFGGAQGSVGYNPMLEVRYYPVHEGEEPGAATERALRYLESAFGYYEIERDKSTRIAGAEARELHLLPSSNDILMVYAALVEQDDGVFLIEGTTLRDRFDKAAGDFSKAARSFKRIEKEDTAVRDAELAQMDKQERFLQQQIDKLPPGWEYLRTERYLFLYHAEKEFVKELAERIEAMRDIYEEVYPPTDPIEAISIVRVCKDVDEYYGYGGRPGTGGYWNSAARELVIFDIRPRDVTLAILNHEAFHQYIYYFYGELAPHSWYNEGHGDYFAGAKLTRSHRIKEFGDAPGGIGLLQSICEAARLLGEGKGAADGGAVPLKELLAFHQSDYYGGRGYDSGMCYAQGWSVVHMLREAKGLQPKWERILPDYLENLLAARREVATELMEKERANAEKREEGSSSELPDQPEQWYGLVDVDKVQDRAYAKTFAEWTPGDWEALQAFWLRYVEKL
jgi:hypothetical protein